MTELSIPNPNCPGGYGKINYITGFSESETVIDSKGIRRVGYFEVTVGLTCERCEKNEFYTETADSPTQAFQQAHQAASAVCPNPDGIIQFPTKS